jgi:peptidoglycan glycosyltransferase
VNTNIRRLGVFFLVAFLIIIGDVTYWQVIDASNMAARADNPRLQIEAAHVRRGFIYDRNGKILAGRTIAADGTVGRYYTDPSLSQVIGYDSARYGKSGLERVFDPYLTGQVFGSSWTVFRNQLEHKPVTGDNLTLTIDDSLQQQVAAILPNAPSSAIVADPRTGEILAMVSKPGFDANQVTSQSYWQSLLTDPNYPLINRPISGYYPPGSTFKIVTLTAALDTHTMSLSSYFAGQQATGPLTVDYHIFCDNIRQSCAPFNNLAPYGVDSVDLEHALMYSDNIVFAEVGLALGQQRFLDYTSRFGLGRPIPFDLPVSVSHVRSPGQKFDRVNLAATAFGQGNLNVTPLQMLLVDEAQANGGVLPRPVLVKQITAPDGSITRTADEGALNRTETADTARQVGEAMTQVVAAGSGFEAQIPGVNVAGKTGTAETGDGKPPHAWFICYAPAEQPRVAVVVMVEHGGEGAFVAAPLAKRILQAALPIVR